MHQPISSYVLKIASRCNLNCKYCYVYNLTDKTYLEQPAVMSRETVDAALARARNHARKHELSKLDFVFHGGEPLLAGPQFFQYFVDAAERVLAPEITPRFSIQTNATLLTKEWLDLFLRLGIRLGISLDGPKEINDINRVDHQGRGSYDRVVAAIELIKSEEAYFRIFDGILTVINPVSDPIEMYRHFRDMGVRKVDFRLPDATYDMPPPFLTVKGTETPYADWLIPVFDQWFADADTSFGIRVFEHIIGLIFGSQVSTVDIGARSAKFVIIETDGGIEPSGALKACYEGITKIGLNVSGNEIDEIYDIPVVALFARASESLCQTCKQCPVVAVCGGGKPPHRYRSENGFYNPSVYCRDLMKLISHVQEKVLETLPPELKRELRLATLKELSELYGNRQGREDCEPLRVYAEA